MRVVIALGGNALLPRGQRPDAAPQVDQVSRVAGPLADLARSHEVVLVHGNGPQVGLLALESAADTSLSRPYPLGERTRVVVIPNTSTDMLREQITSRPSVICAGDIPRSGRSPIPATRVPKQPR